MRSALAVARGSAGISLALASMASAHVCMIAVMSFTPVQLRHHGAGLSAIGYVIGLHVVSMYALAPVFGRLADRFGRIAVVLGGHVLVALGSVAAAVTADNGPVPAAIALVLLGLGWSAVIVAASALLTECAAVADRPGVQGLSDFLISAIGGVGALVGGIVVGAFGFPVLAGAAVALSALLAVVTALGASRVAIAPSEHVDAATPTGGG